MFHCSTFSRLLVTLFPVRLLFLLPCDGIYADRPHALKKFLSEQIQLNADSASALEAR